MCHFESVDVMTDSHVKIDLHYRNLYTWTHSAEFLFSCQSINVQLYTGRTNTLLQCQVHLLTSHQITFSHFNLHISFIWPLYASYFFSRHPLTPLLIILVFWINKLTACSSCLLHVSTMCHTWQAAASCPLTVAQNFGSCRVSMVTTWAAQYKQSWHHCCFLVSINETFSWVVSWICCILRLIRQKHSSISFLVEEIILSSLCDLSDWSVIKEVQWKLKKQHEIRGADSICWSVSHPAAVWKVTLLWMFAPTLLTHF